VGSGLCGINLFRDREGQESPILSRKSSTEFISNLLKNTAKVQIEKAYLDIETRTRDTIVDAFEVFQERRREIAVI
jgi:hypothetical protein